MIFTVSLPGASLVNVRYKWIANGVIGSEQTTGITAVGQFNLFEINTVPPSGADELVAYDVTDLTNYTLGRYLQNIQQAFTPAPPTLFANQLQTVTFRSVYESVVRRMGYDPYGDAVKQDVAQNVLAHINDRVRFSWPVWDWPQLNQIEWRAFRTIWTSTTQFSSGQDLYYLGDGVTPPGAGSSETPTNYPGPNAGYYKCILNAPVSTPPTNLTYFTLYGSTNLPTLADRYIAYNQTGQNLIGEILDVYDHNPRDFPLTFSRILKQSPSSKGVDVQTSVDVVWIRYRLPVSQFTLTPFVPGFTSTNQSYYDPATGNCFTLASTTPNTATDPVIAFPFFLAGYVRAAAYGDAVLETTMEAKIRLAVAQAAQGEAMEYLQREIDTLATQGQKIYYPAFPSRHRRGHQILDQGDVPFEVFKGTS